MKYNRAPASYLAGAQYYVHYSQRAKAHHPKH
jgi:hypothetical protein